MGGRLRLLQAGDLRLNEPLAGVAGLSVPLQERLADAPYVAAQALFDAAIRERVEVVILLGELIGSHQTGSRAPWFLQQQFARLATNGIAVVVRGDELPTPPQGLVWPRNVHVVSPAMPTSFLVRSGSAVRVLDGRGALVRADVAEHQLILSDAPPTQQLLDEFARSFWVSRSAATGVRHSAGGVRSHGVGTLQPRRESVREATGGWVIDLLAGVAEAVEHVDCAPVRWAALSLELSAGSTREGVAQEIRTRLDQLQRVAHE
ncbi:MAG: hypothetical protein KDA58_16670, partial [Planctomycetaceae bacterium]|nr:hypothetical protein [Planctomycetaceae bacterium]